MIKFLKKHLGQSWKTTLVGYILAALIAAQPILPPELGPYSGIVVAVLIGILGKYAADSRQVKDLAQKVDEGEKAIMEDRIQENT